MSKIVWEKHYFLPKSKQDLRKKLRWGITKKGESTVNRACSISNLSLSSSPTLLIKSKFSIEAHHLGENEKEEEEEEDKEEKKQLYAKIISRYIKYLSIRL